MTLADLIKETEEREKREKARQMDQILAGEPRLCVHCSNTVVLTPTHRCPYCEMVLS